MTIRSGILGQLPVFYWPLDDATRTALDASGNSHNGLYGSNFTQGFPGPEAGTLSVGLAPGGNVTAATGFMTAAFTFSIWLSIFEPRAASNAPSFGVHLAGSSYFGFIGGSNVPTDHRASWNDDAIANRQFGGTTVPTDDGNWHHFAWGHNGAGTFKGWVDGSPCLGTTGGSVLGAGGVPYCDTENSNDVFLAHFCGFNRFLSDLDVATMYGAHDVLVPPSNGGFVGGPQGVLLAAQLDLLNEILAAVRKHF